MNDAKSIELAFAQTIRQFAQIGSETKMRVFQSMDFEGDLDTSQGRSFPVLSVSASPPQSEDNQSTMFCDISLICATKVDDDRNHSYLSDMYGEVQKLMNKIYSQFRYGDGEEYCFLNDRIVEHSTAEINTPVSLTWGDSLAPAEDQGLNVIGIGVRVHYGRSDF
ncbi:MAG: hypothetical protein M0P69_14295 [Bacteroidales bacterium]|nr:hypothetical protein [Bacteroidales bacterium]